ncbi:MAG: ABC transporter permease, partial [Phycisphaerales bacterium]
MVHALVNFSQPLAELARLAGPILDKELRVSSRRRRNYALRSAYVVLLCLFIIYVWLVTTRFAGPASASFRASRMALAGRRIITAVIWFQFVAAQLMAIVILSTSISGEIRQRTLSLLMTSPINSLQIVAGKLFSGLLQVMLLAAISLPLLAIIRVLGGVLWGSVVSGLCITLTATLLAGSISLLLSTICRQAYTVVVTVMIMYFVAFGASSALINLLGSYGLLSTTLTDILLYVLNPFGALLAALSATRTAAVVSLWPVHCAAMLSASAAVLSLAVLRVRKAALGRAFRAASKAKDYSPVKRLTGAPVVWKEMRKRCLGYRRAKSVFLAVVVALGSIALLLGT